MIKRMKIKRTSGDFFTSHYAICHKCGIQIDAHKKEMRYTVGCVRGSHTASISLNSNYATFSYTDYCAKCWEKVEKFFKL